MDRASAAQARLATVRNSCDADGSAGGYAPGGGWAPCDGATRRKRASGVARPDSSMTAHRCTSAHRRSAIGETNNFCSKPVMMHPGPSRSPRDGLDVPHWFCLRSLPRCYASQESHGEVLDKVSGPALLCDHFVFACLSVAILMIYFRNAPVYCHTTTEPSPLTSGPPEQVNNNTPWMPSNRYCRRSWGAVSRPGAMCTGPDLKKYDEAIDSARRVQCLGERARGAIAPSLLIRNKEV